jgi:two-component system, chemotaxis family, CheB/CheR fusion protein
MDEGALRGVLECMSDGVVVIDGDGSMLFFNPAAVQLVGLGLTTEPPDAWSRIYGLYLPDTVTLFPVDELPSVRALRGEPTDDVAMFVKNRVVSGRHISVSGRPWRDRNGKELGAVIVFHDIGTRRASEDELRKHRWFLESIVEEVPLMIFVKEARELRFERFNRAGVALLGIKREQLLGRNDYDFFPKEQADFFTTRDRETLELGEIVDIAEEPIRTASGERWLHTRKVPILDDQGQPKYLLGISEDITERKAAAEALHAANEQLEKRVRDRTAELERANEVLRRAESALREADHQKNQFLAVLSHELRNPLAPIRNGLYILERAPHESDQAERARAVIDRQVAHMTRLVDDLLDISRIAHGKVQLQRKTLDLDELVQRTVEDLRSIFVESDVKLDVRGAGRPLWVNGDVTRLAQAIGNLLTNAAKFTPRGGTATVSARLHAGHAVVDVKNTGSGIAPEVLAHLFEPFAQADTSLDRSKGGLGLGLALVKGLVEMHGGSVSAASEGSGAGATFTIRLPLHVEATKTKSPRAAANDGPGRRVLVIEDNIDAADTLRDALELGGHVVEVAYDGAKGIEKAFAFEPDVVLCDIGLPGMDGYDVARTMRADAKLNNIGLIALSGYAQPDDVSKAKDAGFDAHIAKPPTIESVERNLAKVIGARRAP